MYSLVGFIFISLILDIKSINEIESLVPKNSLKLLIISVHGIYKDILLVTIAQKKCVKQ